MRRIRFDGKNRRIALMAILLATCCFLTYYFHAVLGLGTIFSHFFYIPIIVVIIFSFNNATLYLNLMIFINLV